MATQRGGGSLGTPDVLQKLGRPGFPQGLKVLLVLVNAKEHQEIADQMQKLGYQVTSCNTCSQARLLLASKGAVDFDIVLAEASLCAKENREGQLLLEAASALPLVLVSDQGAGPECVWRGIEVGAAEVLEKPLSVLKLQNIWQHVVRKVMDCQEQQALTQRNSLPSIGEESPSQMEGSYLSSRCTLSSNMSAVTAAPLMSTGDTLMVDEVSYSGSQKEESLGPSTSNSHIVDSPPGDLFELTGEAKPAKKARGTGGMALYHQPCGLRSCSSQPLSAVSSFSSVPRVMGMVHPSFATSQGANQAFRGNIPPGCVWGTPLNPPGGGGPGWQGAFPNGARPLLGAAAASINFSRCHSAPASNIDTFCSTLEGMDVLPDLDPALMVNLTDDLLLGDDFLDCGDNFLSSLGASCGPAIPPEPLLEMPPIGLTLKKSESLVNLINQHLTQCQIQVGGN